MPSLREVQQAVRLSLLDGRHPAATFLLYDERIAPQQRLDIYRSTMNGTLLKALRLSYPAVQRIVGTEFFESAALIFARGHPPRCADLNAYGAAFADFLRGFEPAASLPYLPDVARLEWAVNRALHAIDTPSLDLTALAALTPAQQDHVVFTAQPSISMLQSRFPVDSVWLAVLQEDDDAMATIDLDSGPVFMIVERRGGEINLERLAESHWHVTASLFEGETLATALARENDIDAPALLAQHLVADRFASFRISDGHEPR